MWGRSVLRADQGQSSLAAWQLAGWLGSLAGWLAWLAGWLAGWLGAGCGGQRPGLVAGLKPGSQLTS